MYYIMRDVIVVMSAYNGELFLEEQIKSILAQKNVSIKLVIRDDGSSDRTNDIVSSINDSRIEYLKGSNVGCSRSFFELLKYVQSNYHGDSYVAFSDQDDYWLPDKLESACKMLDKLPDNSPNLYISNLFIVNGDLKNPNYLYEDDISLDKGHALVENHATGCTMVFNKNVISMILQSNTDRYRIHDIPIFRMCLFLGNVVYDANPHIYYRQHSNNVIGANYYTKQRFISKVKSFKNFLHQHIKENDAVVFLDEFNSYLSYNDKELIKVVAFYRSNLKYRLALLSGRFKMRRREDNFWFKIRVLLGCI